MPEVRHTDLAFRSADGVPRRAVELFVGREEYLARSILLNLDPQVTDLLENEEDRCEHRCSETLVEKGEQVFQEGQQEAHKQEDRERELLPLVRLGAGLNHDFLPGASDG